MNESFIILLTVVLISRLVLIVLDTPITWRQFAFMLILQTGSVFIIEIETKNLAWWLLLLSPALINGQLFWFETRYRCGDRNLRRILTLVVQTLALVFLCSKLFDLNLVQFVSDLIAKPIPNQPSGDYQKVIIVLAGALLAANEANMIIRLVINQVSLQPKKKEEDETDLKMTDEREYNAGRVIGILERIIVYVLVLEQQYTAIGFILAAKSFARFKELENRETAEYVLIGTLLSALLAMLIGIGVAQFLP